MIGLSGITAGALANIARILGAYLQRPGEALINPLFEYGDIQRYGAIAGQDCTAALARAATEINRAGGGRLYVPAGNWPVTPTPAPLVAGVGIGPALCTFTNCRNLTIQVDGVLVDSTAYADNTAATVFNCIACTGVKTIGQVRVTTQRQIDKTGLTPFVFQQGCTNVDVDVKTTGGHIGVHFFRLDNDPDAYRSKGAHVRLDVDGAEYGLRCDFSGDDVEAWIRANDIGRNYFAFGAANHKIHINSTNQRGATVLACASGFGVDNMEVWTYDRESTVNNPVSQHFILQFSDQTPARMRNVRLHLNLANNPLTPFYHSVTINKVDNGGNRDVVGRGHIIDGLSIDGYSQQVDGVDHVNVFGYFVPLNDQVRNVSVNNLTCQSVGSSQVRLGGIAAASSGYAGVHFDHVQSDGGLFAADSPTITNATNATPVVVTFDQDHDIASGMPLTISGVLGTTNANGARFAKRIGLTTVELYTDVGLTVPVAGNGAYAGGGTAVVTGSAGPKAVYLHCRARNFTGSLGDIGVADYISCEITAGNTQSVDGNKSFSATTTNGANNTNIWPGGYAFTNGIIIVTGVGSPNTVVTAPPGSLYLRSDGGASTSLYVKEGAGLNALGWVAK